MATDSVVEKWNRYCKCSHVEVAHIGYTPYGYNPNFSSFKCTASMHIDDYSYPCRCDVIYKSMVNGIQCWSCDSTVPVNKVVWRGDFKDDEDLWKEIEEEYYVVRQTHTGAQARVKETHYLELEAHKLYLKKLHEEGL